MPPAPAEIRAVLPQVTPGTDKRRHRRFSIRLNLRYRLMEGNRTLHIGPGTTLDMSSGGVLFQANDVDEAEAEEVLRDSGVVAMEIDWPFQLNGVCNLKFILRGRIVRRDGTRLAVRIRRHELRTAGIAQPRFSLGAEGGAS